MAMPTNPSSGWSGSTGGHYAERLFGRTAGPLPSAQYGPAWVADHTTETNHTGRALAVQAADPELAAHLGDDRDAIAVAYARLVATS